MAITSLPTFETRFYLFKYHTHTSDECFDYWCYSNLPLAGGCAELVPILPDLKRRSLTYGLNYPDEEIVCDNYREEKWYSIRQNLPLTSWNIPSTGNCGTLFPIYIGELILLLKMDNGILCLNF